MRACFLCGRSIASCNGFTLVRDWLAAMSGAKLRRIREFCVFCSESGAAWKWINENPTHMEASMTNTDAELVRELRDRLGGDASTLDKVLLALAADAIERLSASSVPEAGNLSILKDHWLTSVNCSHARAVDPTPRDQRGTNYATCSCSMWCGVERASIGEAVDDWVEHVEWIISTAPVSEERRALAKWAREAADDLNWIFAGEPPPDRTKLIEYVANLRALADAVDGETK